MTPVEFLESRITTLIPEDIGSQLMYKSNIKKAKAMETVESMRTEKLEVLAKLLAKTWFYGDWKWETPNERVMQMLMQELGYYPFKDEDEMIQQTQIDSSLYKQAAAEIPGWKAMSVDGPTPMVERLREHLDSITPEEFEKEIDEINKELGAYKEVSDGDIDNAAEIRFGGGDVNYNLRYGFAEGIRWYREQLKKK